MTITELASPVIRSSRLDGLPVAIIGAGPIGLAAAAHLAERGIDFLVFEAGDAPAASITQWGHTRLFSPWSLLVDPAARRALVASGWSEPDAGALPTGSELVRDYLAPLAALPQFASRLRLGVTVDAVTREGMDRTRSAGRADTPFLLRVRDRDGAVSDVAARAIIDASGTYAHPNRLASNGLDPIGIDAVRDRITHALPDVLGRDRARFAGRHTLVVGAGHSAANTLIALARLASAEPGTTITWAIRNAGAVRVSSSDDDQLPARATLGSAVDKLVATGVIAKVDRFEISGVRADAGVVIEGTRAGEVAELHADIVVNATGFRPDLDMLRELRLDLDEIVEAPRLLAPMIDPNLHSCGTVSPHGFRELSHPEPGFFVVGMKSYGRAPTFLLATGYEQVRSVTSWLAGDFEAAEKVELILPATGVCSTDISPGGSCCS